MADSKVSRGKSANASEATKLREKFGFEIKSISSTVGNIQDMQEGLPPREVRLFSPLQQSPQRKEENSNEDVSTNIVIEEKVLADEFHSKESCQTEESSPPVPAEISLENSETASPFQQQSTAAINNISKELEISVKESGNVDKEDENNFQDNISPLSKASKFRTRIKTIIVDSKVAQKQQQEKKQWKGTVGEIGRKAKKVEKEKKIVFTKRLMRCCHFFYYHYLFSFYDFHLSIILEDLLLT